MKCTRIRVTWLASVLALLLTASVLETAHAQSDEQGGDAASATDSARVHFKLGVDFYRERNFRAALIEFQRAYKAAPHYKLLYNLGQTSLDLQEDAAAIGFFTRYLSEGADEITDDRKQEVEQDIARLQARLGTLTVTSNQAGAEIYVDATLIGAAPLRNAIKVSVGRRRIVATKQGYADAERIVDVAAGDAVRVSLDFKERPSIEPTKLQLTAANTTTAEHGMSAAAWAAIATGVVGAGAGTVSVLTMLAQNAYNAEKSHATTAARLQDKRDDAKTKALLADVLWGATLVSAGVTTVLLIAGGSDTERAPGAANAGVALNIGPTSLQLGGSF